MIRRATKDDVPQLLDLGEQFFIESKYEEELGVPLKLEDTVLWYLEMMVRPDALFIVSETKGQIHGFLVGVVIPVFFNWSKKQAMEILWYVDMHHRKGKISKDLMTHFEQWAVDQKASFIEVGSVKTLNMETTSKKFAKYGFPHFRNGHKKKVEVNGWAQ